MMRANNGFVGDGSSAEPMGDQMDWPLWRDVVRLEQKVIGLEQRIDAIACAGIERCALCEARLSVRMIRSHPVLGRLSYQRRVPYCEFCEHLVIDPAP